MSNTRVMRLGQVIPAAKTGRIARRPVYSFNIRQKPWAITPYFIAPVLPAETMKMAMMQARVVSDRVKEPLVGGHIEYFIFYVKLRDLAGRDEFTEMLLDMDKDMSAHFEAASRSWYHFGGAINWAKLCTARVVEEYFRNEGEAWDAYTIGDYPAAMVVQNEAHFLDSAVPDASMAIPDPVVDANSDGSITVGEVNSALERWKRLVHSGLTDQTYEEWLRTYGVSIPREELHRPELIRMIRDWTYPTNTVDPATGEPTTAFSWSIAERADKDRFFGEPGFLLGVTVFRPKVYMANLAGGGHGLMANAMSWLPAVMRDDPWTSMFQIAQGAGPVQNGTDVNGYWVDLKDLLLYGDQFLNWNRTAADGASVALPTPAMQKRYATLTDADALFVAADGYVRQDGRIDLQILGAQQDTSLST